MNDEHVISDEAFNHINSELLKGNQWLAYNTVSYFLDTHDVYLFNSKDEANDFAERNISEFDNYRVIKAKSVDEVLKQIPYGESGISCKRYIEQRRVIGIIKNKGIKFSI